MFSALNHGLRNSPLRSGVVRKRRQPNPGKRMGSSIQPRSVSGREACCLGILEGLRQIHEVCSQIVDDDVWNGATQGLESCLDSS